MWYWQHRIVPHSTTDSLYTFQHSTDLLFVPYKSQARITPVWRQSLHLISHNSSPQTPLYEPNHPILYLLFIVLLIFYISLFIYNMIHIFISIIHQSRACRIYIIHPNDKHTIIYLILISGNDIYYTSVLRPHPLYIPGCLQIIK